MRTNQSSGWEWSRRQKARLAANERDNNGQCQAVLDGCLGVATEVHHVIERADGGGDEAANLAAVCEACHIRLTVEANRVRAAERRGVKKQAKRKNHPGRRDRYDI